MLAPFARVRWSGPHALADTLANLKGARTAFAATLGDVDTREDFLKLRACCRATRLMPLAQGPKWALLRLNSNLRSFG